MYENNVKNKRRHHLVDVDIICLHSRWNIDLHTSFRFFFNDTATTEIYTLSLHDALPIFFTSQICHRRALAPDTFVLSSVLSFRPFSREILRPDARGRSEEHTSELQSRQYLVCRLLLEKKKRKSKCTKTT